MLYCLKILETIESLSAKASIIWLMGQYFQSFPTISQDVLRNLIKGFSSEAEEVKLQILNFAAKIHAAKIVNENTDKITGLISYLLSLASFDPSYTVRQKARVLKAVMLVESGEKDEEVEKTREKILRLMLTQNLKDMYGPGISAKSREESHSKEISGGKFHLHAISFIVFRIFSDSFLERSGCEGSDVGARESGGEGHERETKTETKDSDGVENSGVPVAKEAREKSGVRR